MSSAKIESFLNLLKESRLVGDRWLESARLGASGEKDAGAVARRLVHTGHLTRWQARVLLAGKSGPFFMGNYRLLKPLGEGGMGTVYKAVQAKIGRIVALKVMALKNERSLTRFEREIRAMAALDHPHIVHAFDADRVDDVYFLVMEYVRGRDLKKWIDAAAPLPIGWSCECIRQAALGLQYAHERGIVHRDIKPSNLLLVQKSLQEPPHVKIADFGLARAGFDGIEAGGLTRVGQAVGTSEYIAPEQASDSTAVDIRSDIFSLGCTLFELLTGQFPFRGASPFERLMARFQQDAPPASSLRGEVPPDLDRVVARMLERDPDRRFQTPSDVVEALVPFTSPELTVFREPGGAPVNRTPDPSTADLAGSDAALDQFLESLSGELNSHSFSTLSKPRRRLRAAGLSLAIAALAMLLLLVVVSWTLGSGWWITQ